MASSPAGSDILAREMRRLHVAEYHGMIHAQIVERLGDRRCTARYRTAARIDRTGSSASASVAGLRFDVADLFA
jgi:hypothetical protein